MNIGVMSKTAFVDSLINMITKPIFLYKNIMTHNNANTTIERQIATATPPLPLPLPTTYILK